MSAIFATPVAAVLLAVELLLFEWKPRSFIPVGVASVVAGVSARPRSWGPARFFRWRRTALPALAHGSPRSRSASSPEQGRRAHDARVLCEDLFRKASGPLDVVAAPGGLGVGIGGLIDPRVLGVGYDVIRSLLRGEILGGVLIALLIGKALVWSFSLGSGTSGGVLAPLLIIGGALGALEARWIPVGDPALWALVGMAAIMGGTMRSPLTGDNVRV